MITTPVPTFSSLTKFADFVQLKDYRPPTKDEYVRYVRKLGEHYQCDPATLTEEQVRAYFLFLRQEKKFGGSAMKLARCSLRSFFRDCLHVPDWTVFEEVRIAPPQALPLVLSQRAGGGVAPGRAAPAVSRGAGVDLSHRAAGGRGGAD